MAESYRTRIELRDDNRFDVIREWGSGSSWHKVIEYVTADFKAPRKNLPHRHLWPIGWPSVLSQELINLPPVEIAKPPEIGPNVYDVIAGQRLYIEMLEDVNGVSETHEEFNNGRLPHLFESVNDELFCALCGHEPEHEEHRIAQ